MFMALVRCNRTLLHQSDAYCVLLQAYLHPSSTHLQLRGEPHLSRRRPNDTDSAELPAAAASPPSLSPGGLRGGFSRLVSEP